MHGAIQCIIRSLGPPDQDQNYWVQGPPAPRGPDESSSTLCLSRTSRSPDPDLLRLLGALRSPPDRGPAGSKHFARGMERNAEAQGSPAYSNSETCNPGRTEGPNL